MNHTPRWRARMNFLKHDNRLRPKERNVYLRNLHNIVTEFMQGFLEGDGDDQIRPNERSPLWTPLPWICQNLEISQAHLSRLMRELTGLNPIQTWDKFKFLATGIPLKYIELLQQFLSETLAPDPSSPLAVPPLRYSGNGSKHFWKWLKAQRQNPDFDRQSLAREFDFPNAHRLHRAFYFATDLTPREFENLIIRNAVDNPAELQKIIARFKPPPPPPAQPESSPNERMVPAELQRCYPPMDNELNLADLRDRHPDLIPVFNLARPKYLDKKFPLILYERPIVEFILVTPKRRKRRTKAIHRRLPIPA